MHFAVVGAGIAGVSVSAALLERGFTITLFERSPRAGGRMNTRLLRGQGEARVSCDHGAQYFTARNAGFQQVVKSWLQRGWAAPWQGRVASELRTADASLVPTTDASATPATDASVAPSRDASATPAVDASVAEATGASALAPRLGAGPPLGVRPPPLVGVAADVTAFVAAGLGEPPPIRHLKASEPRYVGTPEMTTPVRMELERLHSIAGAQFCWCPSHKLVLVRRLDVADAAATMADQARMASHGCVSSDPALPQATEVLREGPGWLLDFELLGEESAHRSMAFDGVVLAMPRAQFEVFFGAPPGDSSGVRSRSTAESRDGHSRQDRNEAANALWPLPATWLHDWEPTRMQACWALMLRYEGPLSLPFDGLFCNDPRASWLCRNNSKPGRSAEECWVVHAAPAWSEAHLGADPGWITEQLEAVLRAHGAPPAISRELHRWRYASCEGRAPSDAYWDPDTRIGVCGDWLEGGRVEGAWLSARALAERIAKTVSLRP